MVNKYNIFYWFLTLTKNISTAISKLTDGSNVEIKEEPIEIESYASLISVLYNHNWLGFQLDRNGINY